MKAFAVGDVADLLWGCKPGHTARLPGLIRSAIDQHRVVTPQVLHLAPCPETASLAPAATTSTPPTQTCCRSSPSCARSNVVRPPAGPPHTPPIANLPPPT